MASSGIPLDTGALMSAVLEAVLYGFSVLMFMGTIWSLTYKQHMRDVNRPIVAVAILLFILSTAHVVLSIIRVEDGLVKYRNTYPGGPVAFFADISQETYVIKHALFAATSFGMTGVHGVYNASRYNTSIFTQELETWIIGFFISAIAANVLSSGILAYRIWAIERDVATIRASTKSTMMPIIRVLVDAAVLYSMALVTTLICFLLSSNGEYVMVDLVMPIISISFYMVLIRVAINRNHSYLSIVGTTAGTEQGNLQKYPVQPLQGMSTSRQDLREEITSLGVGKMVADTMAECD
ncbi:hypothetical protein P692DRAFT_20867808 [Suillus brevipes Sb2]|nr:hypothetical protein P692DRAFT_20867808 [Suillus brevipes Sb2]